MKVQPTASAYEGSDKVAPEADADENVAFGSALLSFVLPVPPVQLPQPRVADGASTRMSSAVEAEVRAQVETHTAGSAQSASESESNPSEEGADSSAQTKTTEEPDHKAQLPQKQSIPRVQTAETDVQNRVSAAQDQARVEPVVNVIVQVAHREVVPVTHAENVPQASRSEALPTPAPAELSKVRVSDSSTGARAAIVELDHPELGRMELEMRNGKNGLEVLARTASLTAAVALRASENLLRASVASRGIRLTKLRVAVAEDAERTEDPKNKMRARRKRPLDMEA